MTPTDKSNDSWSSSPLLKEYVVPLGSTASDYDIAIQAFYFIDYFTIWREDIQEHVLNGSPEQVEIALRKLLREVNDGSD